MHIYILCVDTCVYFGVWGVRMSKCVCHML